MASKHAKANPRWLGWDVHAYTNQMRAILPTVNEILDDKMHRIPNHIGREHMNIIIQQIQNHYGPRVSVACSNIMKCYQTKPIPGIFDHELVGVDFARVLLYLWLHVTKVNDPSLYAHFGETLENIGATCLQGVTHRLLVDFVAVSDNVHKKKETLG